MAERNIRFPPIAGGRLPMQIGNVKRGIPSLAATTLVLASCAGSPSQPTLCELPNDRSAYAGKQLTVEGDLSVTRHGSTVSERHCDKHMPVSWSKEAASHMPDVDAAALRLESERLIVRVRVTGVIKRAERQEFIDQRYWYLDVTAGDVLSVKPLAN